jgi:hypothetical protein
MITRTITVTGVDDRVDIDWMMSLSQKYTWLEWGILRSHNRRGVARYPSDDWFLRLIAAAETTSPRLSLHLCGALSRDPPFAEMPRVFQRVQLNGWSMKTYDEPVPFIGEGVTTIVPVRNVSAAHIVTSRSPRTHVLIDSSGGRGNRARLFDKIDQCPLAHVESLDLSEYDPSPGTTIGFAGGLHPSETRRMMRILSLRLKNHSFWLDMESKARDANDVFDVGSIEDMCEEIGGMI